MLDLRAKPDAELRTDPALKGPRVKPVVAHICETFLPVSDTFIHQFLCHTPDSTPTVLCFERQNAAALPFHAVTQLSYPAPLSKHRVSASLKRRLSLDPLASSLTGVIQEGLQELRPDLVHAHFGPEGVRVMPACRELGMPMVVSFYGYDLSMNLRSDHWIKAYREMFGYADAVIALSEDFQRRLVNIGCPPAKIRLIRIGTDAEKFSYAPHEDRSGKLGLLGVGRMVQKKGTAYLLDALAEMRNQIPALTYRHIGTGPLESELQAKCTRLGLDDVVTWLGERDNDTVLQEMKAADALIVPSVTADDGDTEGIPGVVYEAMAIGLTVVATRHAGIPEVIVDNVTGFLADEKDSHGLAQALCALHRYRFRTEPTRIAARKYIEERANSVLCGKQLDKVYAEIVRGR